GCATPGAGTADHGDRRFGQVFESASVAIVVALVLERVFGRGKGAELRDVGACDERLVTRAAQHQDLDPLVGVDVLAALVQTFVHGPGQRVARLGTNEG